MTAYDFIRFSCSSCGKPVTVPSKVGAARYLDFSAHSVPTAMATDIDGRRVKCSSCGAEFFVASQLPYRVRCQLVSTLVTDRTMPCIACNSSMTARVEDVQFHVDVVLADITIYRCSACGSEETAIPRLSGLITCLQREKQRPVRLTPGVDW